MCKNSHDSLWKSLILKINGYKIKGSNDLGSLHTLMPVILIEKCALV